jgi:Fe-S-cluster containining protein
VIDVRITDADCQSCGACCQTSHPAVRASVRLQHWASCTPADLNRMPRRVRLKLVPTRTLDGVQGCATPLRPDGTCGFLRGVVGAKVKCGIYDVRPALCRAFAAGSEFCRASRREIGLPA